jgi:hypothetical protein
MRDEVQDRYGNIIYLTDERWQHIVKYHHQLDGRRADVLSTVRSGMRYRDPFTPEKFYYIKAFPNLGGRFKRIKVVVVFHMRVNEPNNFIVTAYPIK